MAQVVEHVGGGRKIGESFKGILVRLVFGSFVLLGWNELNTVNHRTVSRVARSWWKPRAVDAAKDGKLIHVAGAAKTDETLKDGVFTCKVQAMCLVRDVEMFQWEEKVESRTEKKLGRGRGPYQDVLLQQGGGTGAGLIRPSLRTGPVGDESAVHAV